MEQLREANRDLLARDVELEVAGQSASLLIRVKEIDRFETASEQMDAIREGLRAAYRLATLTRMVRLVQRRSTGTRRTASVTARSRSNGSSTGSRAQRARFVVCVDNTGYDASLDVRKIYRVLADARADKLGLVRVIDESGEDYLYPRALFAAIELSPSVRRRLDG
jgi:hypothetical protein